MNSLYSWGALAVLWAILAPTPAVAQDNSVAGLFDSPVKVESESYQMGAVLTCSASYPGTAALFGADTVVEGASSRFLVNELFGTFRTWEMDAACNLIATWSTAFSGSTQTGVAVPNGNTSVYWAVDTAASTVDQYVRGTGAATGVSVPLSGGLLYGAMVIDDNQPGQIGCYDEIVNDTYTCIDMTANGAFLCQYANQDNTGAGAFGNAIGDALVPSDCSGATLVQATGPIGGGQVTCVGQYDCNVVDPSCLCTWDVGVYSTFTNDVEEFDLNGMHGLIMVDNSSSSVYILIRSIGIQDCQPNDTGMNLLWANASQGGAFSTVIVPQTAPLSTAMHRAPGGDGRFVFHLDAGVPGITTVTSLFDLGNTCFPFLRSTHAVVENNVGRTDLIGASSYFAALKPDPAHSPAFIQPTAPVVDAANMPSGSFFTGQSVHVNAQSSSTRGASISNPLIYNVQ